MIESVSEVKINGSTLRLNDVTIYPEGFSGVDAKNLVGPRDIITWKNQVIDLAKAQNFTELIISGMRAPKSSSSNPGKTIDLRIDLTK